MRFPLVPVLVLAALAGCRAAPRYFPAPDPSLPFSSAVLVGDTLHVAGHLGRDPATGMAPADPKEEARLLLDAFEATLDRADMAMDDLVMVHVYCSDVSLYDVWNAAYRERFSGDFPARAFIGSGTLLRGCRFEMLGTAVRK